MPGISLKFGDRMKIGFIVAIITISSLLLGIICLIRSRSYLWVILLLLAFVLWGVGTMFWMIKRKIVLAELRSNFVSNISHELKTPLTSINMFVEMLLLGLYERETDPEQYLRIIQKENNRLINLVDRVLDFSKIEKGKMEFQYKQEPIREVILSALEVFETHFGENGWEIKVNLADNLPVLEIDRDAIIEALLNLLINAAKYSTDNKKIIINAQVVNHYVSIEVIDNGIGIPKWEQKKIFQPFYRIKGLKEVEGSGLGLAYVKHITEAHKGKVTVQSKVGCGSKFTLLLPYSREKR